MTNHLDEICTRVEACLAADFDAADAEETEDGNALMAALEAAVAAHPGEARLYGLRARMNAMAGYIFDAAADWERMLELAPGERGAALELAKLRLRHADSMAEAAVRRAKDAGAGASANADEDEDDGEEDDWDEADEASAAALARRYREGSIASLHALMRAHAAELPFVGAMLDALDELYSVGPWVHYALLLEALAAHPGEAQLLAREAAFLASLAGYCGVESDEIPNGYLESVDGQRYHVATLVRALRAIDGCGAAIPDLLASKGDLLGAMDDYPGAASAYLQAAALFDAQGARCEGEARESLEQEGAAARRRAGLCLQGRAALIEDRYSQMSEALDQLAAMRSSRGRAPDIDDLDSQLPACREWMEAAGQAMDEGQRDRYRELAQSVARQTVGLVSFEPIVLDPIGQAQLEGGISPWYAEMRPELDAAGLSFLQQFDNPANTRMLGMQCQGQVWTDPAGGSALVAETVRTIRLKRLVTQFSDGTFLMTADTRGRSFWEFGPTIDSMSVEADTPIGDMVRLHMARVARRLADASGLRTVPIDSLARLAQVENKTRVDKNEFRFREKITDVEVRGMHVQFHDQFKALLQGAVAEKLAALARPAASA